MLLNWHFCTHKVGGALYLIWHQSSLQVFYALGRQGRGGCPKQVLPCGGTTFLIASADTLSSHAIHSHLQRGYKMHDRVIRPAEVGVVRAP